LDVTSSTHPAIWLSWWSRTRDRARQSLRKPSNSWLSALGVITHLKGVKHKQSDHEGMVTELILTNPIGMQGIDNLITSTTPPQPYVPPALQPAKSNQFASL
jgi:hypothetical protein